MKHTGLAIALVTIMIGPSLSQRSAAVAAETKPSAGSVTVFIGTYTKGWACPPPGKEGSACSSQGIYRTEFDLATGKLGEATLAATSDNPSYLAVHPSGKYLYAVNEVGDYKGKDVKPDEKTGAVSAFAIEAGGKLRLINQLSSHGADPCHVSLDASGLRVLVANYSGGTVASYLIGPDGGLKDASSVLDAGAHGPHANQDGPHAHFIVEGPLVGLVYVADLGLDKVLLYNLDGKSGKLVPHAPQPFATVTPPGSGPRHIAIAADGKFLYTNNELTSAASVFTRDPATGALSPEPLQTISTVPASHKGRNDNAELLLAPGGRHLFVSNRGHDSITTFAVDPATGKLKTAGNVKSGGKEPRDFKIDPSGSFLLVGHQVSDDVFVFKLDAKTGKLGKTKTRLTVSKPVNFAFWKAP